jgi:ribonuclease J
MEIEVCSLGGYSQVGANMTAVKVGEDVILFDMGYNIPAVIKVQEEETKDKTKLSRTQMISAGAVPDDSPISKNWRKKVKAIVLGHCHLDHIGAVPFLAGRYDCPIYGTPFTIEVLKTTLTDDRMKISNPLKVLNPNSRIKINDNITLEFVHTTHSTPQTVIAVIHTPVGAIMYGNDFKFDNHPIVGKRPNYKRLEELGKEGVKMLIVDALYSYQKIKTPSENVARDMLEDVMMHTPSEGKLIIATTFASHIARLKSIITFGKKLNRKVVILGRSMNKYISSAQRAKIINLAEGVHLYKYGTEVRKILREVQQNPGKYLVVCTGHQGEPGAVLTRLSTGELPFKFQEGDHVIFACKTIPAPINIAQREALENKLKQKKLRMFLDIHTSGHLAREDHRDMINMVKPMHIIPAQGDHAKLMPLADLAIEMGYTLGENVHIMHDGLFKKFVV